MKRRTQFFAVIAVILVGIAPSHAIPIGFGSATIDGSSSAGEWDNAVSWSVFSGSYAGSTFYMMNDLDNLYIGLSVVDSTFMLDDILEVRFDNANNGIFDVGDDELFLSANGFTDSHFNGTFWGSTDSITNGDGAVQGLGAFNFFEMVHPLSSGDVLDFSLTAGDTVGFCVRYFDDGTATSNTTNFPVACSLAAGEQSGYAKYVVATVPEPSTLALFALGILGIGFSSMRRGRCLWTK